MLGRLQYSVAYGAFAYSLDYRPRVSAYLGQHLGQAISPLWDLVSGDTDAGTVIRIGEWLLTAAGTVGAGASGRVSIGINSTGHTVALKRFAVEGDRTRVGARRRKLERITELARRMDEKRVLRLRDVLQDDAAGGCNRAVDVWFVLEPAVPSTLMETHKVWSLKDRASRLRHLTRFVAAELLGALDFLHSNGWIHGDLKPNNIGVLDQRAERLQIVLLDVDEVFPLQAEGRLHTYPPGSTGGTVGWLSPERETMGFDQSCDVWSLGVLIVWLVTG
ncbi:protein kinasedomain-containing protein [Cordyceps javanica]|uniref:Protein kinasedomain-containing protein n=1 Tax=Cordyceps javanica TaxID=43265 RepID=A0A545ULD6_9HYPO|nr:protein kinasedomain-containing protein [Cordyceps javanica]TQW01727.1 protein kinase domain-containing protein [Cordyceps javanica]